MITACMPTEGRITTLLVALFFQLACLLACSLACFLHGSLVAGLCYCLVGRPSKQASKQESKGAAQERKQGGLPNRPNDGTLALHTRGVKQFNVIHVARH